jgi:polysaccharide biosynthesis transport protein
MTRNDEKATSDGRDNLPSVADRRSKALEPARDRQQIANAVRADNVADEGEIDLRSYWRILVKRRWTVLGTLAIVFITALVGTLLMTPIYRATAVVQIERDTIKVVDVGSMTPVEGSGDRDFYQTQYELLRSRALLQRAVSRMGLAENSDLERITPRSPWVKLMSMFADEGASDEAGPTAASTASTPASIDDRRRNLVGAFAGGLAIEPVRNSRLVRIHYDSPDRAFSQRAANAVAESFIASNLDRRLDSSSYAKEYLEDRLQELKLKLEESERQLVSFAQQEQIVDTGSESGSLTQKTLESLSASLSKAKEDRIRAESRWKQAQSSRGLVLYGDIGENSIIQTLQQGRAKMLTDYQEKLRLFKPGYPVMQQLDSQIKEVEKQIAQEVGNIKSAIHAEYLSAQQQEQMLAEQLGIARTDELDLQKRSIQYNIFKREVDTNRQLYDGLLQRYKEVGVAGGVSSNNISIIDRAEQGSKFAPNLRTNLALGLLIGLLLGVLLALGFEYMDDTLKSPEDIEKILGLALLGVIPKLKQPQSPLRALDDPRSAFAEAYRSLRTALQFATSRGVPRCLLVTSSTSGEGKSTTAIALARHFAQLGKRVLLIDCDLRNPSLHRQLAVDNSIGLTNCLTGSAKPNDIIRTTETPNLSLVPAGPLPPSPAELLMGPQMLVLLTGAITKYDQVILDGPPVLGLADAPVLANIASGTLLVVEAGSTRIVVTRTAIKRLQMTRSRIIGAVLTKFESRHASYGYDYGQSYYAYGASPARRLDKK